MEPLPFLLIAPYPPAYDAGARSTVFHPDKSISNLKQIFHTGNIQSNKMVRRSNKFGNPNVSQPRHITLPLSEYMRYSTQGTRCSNTVSVVLMLTPTLWLHHLPSTRLPRVYKNHYELLLLLRLQLKLLRGLFPQGLLHQNPRNARLLLLVVVHLAPLDNRI